MRKQILNFSLAILGLVLFSQCTSKKEVERLTLNFGKAWRFRLGKVAEAEAVKFDDSAWRKLNVPHDWSIEGEFSEKNPATVGGGALPGGIGWYRKSFKVTADDLKGCVFIDFDGGVSEQRSLDQRTFAR